MALSVTASPVTRIPDLDPVTSTSWPWPWPYAPNWPTGPSVCLAGLTGTVIYQTCCLLTFCLCVVLHKSSLISSPFMWPKLSRFCLWTLEPDLGLTFPLSLGPEPEPLGPVHDRARVVPRSVDCSPGRELTSLPLFWHPVSLLPCKPHLGTVFAASRIQPITLNLNLTRVRRRRRLPEPYLLPTLGPSY